MARFAVWRRDILQRFGSRRSSAAAGARSSGRARGARFPDDPEVRATQGMDLVKGNPWAWTRRVRDFRVLQVFLAD
jgi:hypothetical protein